MHIALIADVFPPLRSSGAVQLRDLSLEMADQGHQVTVIIPDSSLDSTFVIENLHEVRILRLKAPQTKDIGYIKRVINEFLMPFAMMRSLKGCPLANTKWDGVIWYSPTIFLGPIVNRLKRVNKCRSYLIVRDIFPAWALDMGLLSKGLPYYFFKLIEQYQYSVADVIGVQTPGNTSYFQKWVNARPNVRKTETLQNWLTASQNIGCSISVRDTSLSGRHICVYAGNMGVAQGMDIWIDVATQLQHSDDIGFLFVGRGSETNKLRALAVERKLNNIFFHPEVDPSEIAGLYAQCHVGIVALDQRHKTHNIPGKFISYMHSGLPVIASINAGNDLVEIIKTERLGKVSVDYAADKLASQLQELVASLPSDLELSKRCKTYGELNFSSKNAVSQIIRQLSAK